MPLKNSLTGQDVSDIISVIISDIFMDKKKVLATRKGERLVKYDDAVAGLILEGWEVKAIRAGKMSLQGAFIKYMTYPNGSSGFALLGAHIEPLEQHKTQGYNPDPVRIRPLLMQKPQIIRWYQKIKEKGYTVLPEVVFNGRYLKIQITLGRGEKKYETKDRIAERDWQREKSRLMKNALK